MANVKEIISLFKEKIKEFEESKDYSVFLKSGEETYTIKSQGLKKNLREVIDFNPSSGHSSVMHSKEQCDSEGNCFSYRGKKEINDASLDELTLQKKEVKEGRVSHEEIERRRKEVEQKRREVEELRNDEQRRREKGLPTSDYISSTHTIKKRGGKNSTEFHSYSQPQEKSDTSQTQTVNQEAKQQTPNFPYKPRQ